MEREQYIIERIKHQAMMPLFYHEDPEVCKEVVGALYAAGVRLIEFTNRGAAAMTNFKLLVDARDTQMKDLLLGVGTIRTAEQARNFIAAGADFLISPVFDAAVADEAYMSKVLWIPGCMTPTEVHVAGNAGCVLVKLFPGNVLGPGYVQAVKELFPDMMFMPTGGVEATRENLSAWFNAGVVAVGMGSKLISKSLLEQKNYAAITEATKNVFELLK